jgi:hypothetical protein
MRPLLPSPRGPLGGFTGRLAPAGPKDCDILIELEKQEIDSGFQELLRMYNAMLPLMRSSRGREGGCGTRLLPEPSSKFCVGFVWTTCLF